ncbi:unnamed protein product [Paramecium primaurelia]|uniref:Transmembrane protein n=1 Tax=Paramecium primaurelia TaxID=5886 RepID=A0A8S1NY69_PARPR|nr:unnamed protein product [Paramecium primaurelia]
MKKTIQKAKNIHYILHFDQANISESVLLFTNFLYLAQLLNLGKHFEPNSEIVTIYSLLKSTFILNLIPEKYFPHIQILLLIYNLSLAISILTVVLLNINHNSKNWILLMITINVTLNVYPNVFFIPNLWLNIKQCFTQNILYFFISLINIIFTLIITFFIVFFQRGDSLAQNENITNTIIIIRILLKLTEFITIYLSFLDDTISFILEQFILISIIFLNLFKLTAISSNKVQLSIQFFLFNLSLLADYRMMDYLLISILILSLQQQIQFRKLQQILFNSDTILSCQLAERVYKKCLIDKQARIQLLVFKNNHKCTKCKAFYDIIECILKKNCKNERDKIIYANFISKKWPLRALVELLKEQNEDFYFQSAILTFQKTNESTFDITNYIYTSYKSQIECESIKSKLLSLITFMIKFWNQTIMNQFGIKQFYKQVQQVGKKIDQINKIMDKVYDIRNCKLKNNQFSDIITLRLLQIYYCVANVDLIKAQQMEDKINDLFRSDKFRQSNTIDNNQLATNRSMLLTTSLIYNTNKLLQPNYQQISLFFDAQIEEVNFIKTSMEMMPQFISNVHDQLIENFIQKGQSRLCQQGQQTYYQNLQGYIVPCNIHLIPIQGQNDYLINAILTKDLNYNQCIIFGMNGRLYGMTQDFFEFSLQSMQFDTYTKNLSINDLIDKGSLIQYYIENIQEQIQLLKQSIEKHQNYLILEVQSQWQYPENHLNCVFNTNQLIKQQYNSSMNQMLSFSNFMSQKTYLQTSKQTEKSAQVYEFDESGSQNKELMIDGVEWSILNQSYHNSIRQMIDQFSEKQKTNRIRLVMIYSLSFKKISFGKRSLGYFVMELKDYRQEFTQKTTSQYLTTYQTKKTESSQKNKSSYSFPASDLDDIYSEKPIIDDDLDNQIKQINLKNHLLYLNKLEIDKRTIIQNENQISSINVTKQKMQSYDFDNSSRLLKIQTDRQPKKHLLTTRIELQSINIQQDDDDIMQEVEKEFDEIVFERKMINNQEQDDDNFDIQRDRNQKDCYQKQKTKIINEQLSNQTFTKQLFALKDTFQYLEKISSNKFTINSLQKFIYFSFCVIILLLINVIIDSLKAYTHVQENDNFIIQTLDEIKFHRICAIKLSLLITKLLGEYSIINKNQFIFQLQQKQIQNIYDYNTYNQQYQLINTYESNQQVTSEQFNILLQQFDNDMRKGYYNTEQITFINSTFQFTNDTQFIFNYLYDIVIHKLDNYDDQQVDYISASIFIILYILLIVYQIKFLYAKQKVIIKLLKLAHQTNINKIQNQIARLSTIKDTFECNNSKNWKLTSYVQIISEEVQHEKSQKKQNHDLEGNIGHQYLYPNIIAILFLCLFAAMGLFFQLIYYQKEYLTIQNQFLKLNIMIDHSLIYGSLIKTYEILKITKSLDNSIIENFNESINNQIDITNNIIDDLERLQESNLLDSLINDQCLYFQDMIEYCKNKQYPYNEMYQIIERGIISLTNNIQKVKNTEFNYELTTKQFQKESKELIEYINSQSFINTFLIYFIESVNILDKEIEKIYQVGQDQFNNYVLMIQLYEIGVGISIGLMYLLYGYLTQIYHRSDFKIIILFLRTIPNEQMQLKNILHQIKNIVQEK